MKKILTLILAACMVLSMGAVVQAEGVSGEFTGTANGMGEVTVTLTLEDGKIVGCTATGANETAGIGSVVIDTFPATVAESGSIAVDAISGATITSNAFAEAAAAALTAAGLNPDDYKTAIENMIAARKSVGLTNKSSVTVTAVATYYEARAIGRRGELICRIGAKAPTSVPDGFEEACSGSGWAFYVKK